MNMTWLRDIIDNGTSQAFLGKAEKKGGEDRNTSR